MSILIFSLYIHLLDVDNTLCTEACATLDFLVWAEFWMLSIYLFVWIPKYELIQNS